MFIRSSRSVTTNALAPTQELKAASFTQRKYATVTDALRGTALAQYAAAFTRANLDDAELCDLNALGIPEIQSLVPDAPLSDIVQLRAVLSKAFERVPRYPASPFWFYAGPSISTMEMNASTMNEVFLVWEVSLIVSTLIIGISIGILLDAKLQCANGDPCETLVIADVAIWALVVMNAAFSIAAAFINISAFRAVCPCDRPAWMARLWCMGMLPVVLAIVAINLFIIGIMTRMHLVFAAQQQLAWLATSILCVFFVTPIFMAPYVFTRTPALAHPSINMVNFWPYFLTGGIGAYLPKPTQKVSVSAASISPENATPPQKQAQT